MKPFILLSSLFIFLFSCQQKADSGKIKQFAQTIHDYTHFQIKASQQAFVNKLTEDLQSLQQNNDAVIDTRQLRDLLAKAKEANRVSYEHIKNAAEVDDEINLRQKALDENQLFDSLYNNQFAKTIDILESHDTNKREELSKIIDGQLEERINKVQRASKEADDEFTNKYDISFPEDSTK
jgi:Glu-tRNA(Gln) amidotransferase subunit E-like FAD-binding protein